MEKYLKAFQQYAKKNPIIVGLIALAIFIVIIGWIYICQYKASIKEYNQAVTTIEQLSPATTTETTTKPTTPKPAAPKPTVPGNATETYLEALEKYANRKVQMSNCLATPTKMTFKNNVALMFDNRDNAAIELRIDGKSNTIGALNYKVITFSSKTLPHTVDIDCYKAGKPTYNVASVTLVQ